MPKPQTFESEKKFRKPNAWLKEFHNVEKLIDYQRVQIKKKRKEILVCSTAVLEYQMFDGSIEEQAGNPYLCATIPKDILPQIIKALKEVSK